MNKNRARCIARGKAPKSQNFVHEGKHSKHLKTMFAKNIDFVLTVTAIRTDSPN